MANNIRPIVNPDIVPIPQGSHKQIMAVALTPNRELRNRTKQTACRDEFSPALAITAPASPRTCTAASKQQPVSIAFLILGLRIHSNGGGVNASRVPKVRFAGQAWRLICVDALFSVFLGSIFVVRQQRHHRPQSFPNYTALKLLQTLRAQVPPIAGKEMRGASYRKRGTR